MADDFLSNLAAGMKVWGGVSQAYHDRDVTNRIDQIMKASNGGRSDLNGIDPSLTNDNIGMEAMGKITAQLAKTGEAQNQIFNNAVVSANNQWKVANQYQSDFNRAVEEGRQGDATNLLISMGNSMGIPYRYSMGENGNIKVTHMTPDGDVDMGEMSLVEAGKMAKGYLSNQDQFVRNSVMHNMTMADQNAQIQAAGASKWMHGIDPKSGRMVMAFPQYNLNNGQIEYYVQGVGKVSAEQLGNLGIQWGTAGQVSRAGLRGIGGTGGGGGRGRGLGGTSGGGSSDTGGGKEFKLTAGDRDFIRKQASYTDDDGSKRTSNLLAATLEDMTKRTGSASASINQLDAAIEQMIQSGVAPNGEQISPERISQFASWPEWKQRERFCMMLKMPKVQTQEQTQQAQTAQPATQNPQQDKPQGGPAPAQPVSQSPLLRVATGQVDSDGRPTTGLRRLQ